MFTKIDEIKKAVNAFKNDTVFIKTQRRWDDDYDLWRLKDYDAGKGYYSYTSNSPRNLANKAVSMLTEAKLLIGIPEDMLQADEREVASNVERYMYGILNMTDTTLTRHKDASSHSRYYNDELLNYGVCVLVEQNRFWSCIGIVYLHFHPFYPSRPDRFSNCVF